MMLVNILLGHTQISDHPLRRFIGVQDGKKKKIIFFTETIMDEVIVKYRLYYL